MPRRSDATPDTPKERDAKADVLVAKAEHKAEVLRIERDELARIIAAETKKFRWEVRLYWLVMAVILYINT